MKISQNELKIVILFHKEFHKNKYVQDFPQIVAPLLIGRDGISKDVKPWLPNMLFDNVGDNISWANPFINELTGLYWIWKHSDAIGNPENICVQQYARLFEPMDVFLTMKKSEVLVFHEFLDGATILQQLSYYAFSNIFLDIAKMSLNQNLTKYFADFLDEKAFASREMFCMPWSLFDDMMKFVYDILIRAISFVPLTNDNEFNEDYGRCVGYCMERFIGFYFYLLEQFKPDLINYTVPLEWE